jgi:uncharacterized protein YukJ
MASTTPHYGYVKCTVASEPTLSSKYLADQQETQYHLHATLRTATPTGGTLDFETAINVGTSDADDLLRYKIVYDFKHAVRTTLSAAKPGQHELTGQHALPALDFLRTDILAGTGIWRDSDVMDGGEDREPYASLKALLMKAKAAGTNVYVFGRLYPPPEHGLHDVHMNQGSTGKYLNTPGSTNKERNQTWQDGAVLVDLGQPLWAAYFTAFTQQFVPTDDLGNPTPDSHKVDQVDDGSLAGG